MGAGSLAQAVDGHTAEVTACSVPWSTGAGGSPGRVEPAVSSGGLPEVTLTCPAGQGKGCARLHLRSSGAVTGPDARGDGCCLSLGRRRCWPQPSLEVWLAAAYGLVTSSLP